MVYCPKCGKSMASYVEHDCTSIKRISMKSYEIEKIMKNNPNVEVVVRIDDRSYNIIDSNWQGFENGGKLELLVASEDN